VCSRSNSGDSDFGFWRQYEVVLPSSCPLSEYPVYGWPHSMLSRDQARAEYCKDLPWVMGRTVILLIETRRVAAGEVIACIEDPVVIKKVLTYLEEKLPTRAALLLPDSRAPPQSGLFG
jgi:hypothetical protein